MSDGQTEVASPQITRLRKKSTACVPACFFPRKRARFWPSRFLLTQNFELSLVLGVLAGKVAVNGHKVAVNAGQFSPENN